MKDEHEHFSVFSSWVPVLARPCLAQQWQAECHLVDKHLYSQYIKHGPVFSPLVGRKSIMVCKYDPGQQGACRTMQFLTILPSWYRATTLLGVCQTAPVESKHIFPSSALFWMMLVVICSRYSLGWLINREQFPTVENVPFLSWYVNYNISHASKDQSQLIFRESLND